MGACMDSQISPGFSVADEGDNFFLIRHPNGTTAPIAKKGLSETQISEINGLPKSPDKVAIAAPAGYPLPTEVNLAPTSSHWMPPKTGVLPDANQIPTPLPEQNIAPVVEPTLQPAQPVTVQGVPEVAQPIQPQVIPAPAKQTVASNPLSQFNKVQDEAVRQQQELAQNFQKTLQDTTKYYADQRTQLDQEQAKLKQDYQNGKIDPDHFWNSKTGIKGGASRVLSMLGLFLGGMSQSKTGINPAQAMLQKAIDADIDAQKETLGKNKTLLDMNMQKYGDMRLAEQATKLDMMNMFNVQLQGVAMKSNSAKLKLEASNQAQELQLKIAEASDKLAKEKTGQKLIQYMSSGAQIPDQAIALLPKELQEKSVKITNPITGKSQWMLGKTPEGVKEIEKINGTTQNLIGLIDEMKAARQRHQGDLIGATSILPWTQKSEEYNQLHGAAIEELRSLSQGARLNEGTLKYLSEIIPAPGSAKTSDEELDRAKNILIQKLNNEIQGRVLNAPTLNPLQARSQDVRP